ncbi:MAG: signal peptidase II [Gammaproteobacteria bacterium]
MSGPARGHGWLQGSAAPWLWLSVLVIVLDQLSKYLVASHLELYRPVRVLPVFNLVLIYNSGAAWNFLSGASGWQRWFFVGLALAVSVAIVVWIVRLPRHVQRWRAAALALVLGGALGNVIDRLWHGYVTDFLQFHWRALYYPTFNLADSAITIGAAMLIIEGLFFARRSGGRA